MSTWTETDPRIASSRAAMTDRAGRWVTVQVGRGGRAVAEVARELRLVGLPVVDIWVARELGEDRGGTGPSASVDPADRFVGVCRGEPRAAP